MLNKTTARKFIAPRRQGAKLRILFAFFELGVFASLRESSLFLLCKARLNRKIQISLASTSSLPCPYKNEAPGRLDSKMNRKTAIERLGFSILDFGMNYPAASCGVSEQSRTAYSAVTPECFNRGSSSGLAWIPAKSMRE